MLDVHPEAERELQAAIIWYERERPGLGSEFAAAIEEAFDAIQASPRACSPVPGWRSERLGIRRFGLDRFPFTVPFVIQEELVTVLAVAHVRRRPGYWLTRVTRR